jgi:hypothetical protein
MTQILTTASGNFSNKKSWNGIKKHLKHDPNITHKNEFLNTAESKALRKYNRHVVLIDYDKFCEDNFGAYVADHDAHMKDRRRKFGSVKRFLEVDNTGKTRTLQPAQLYTEKLSNEEDYKRFLKLLVNTIKKQNPTFNDEKVKDTAYRIVNAGLMRYAKGFNDRNPNLKMFEYYTHLDEEGAPHLHSRVMPFVKPNGTTKTGRLKKPSWSLNKALGEQYHNMGKNKENLRRFRKQEDQAMIDSMNYALEKTCHLKPIFKLIRKTDKDQTLQTGLDHEVYKAKQHKLGELNTKINAKQNDLLAVTDAVSEQTEKLVTTTKKLKDTEAKNETLIKQQAKREKRLEARERDLNAVELGGVDSKGIKHIGLAQRKMALDDRETRLKNWATDLNAKENGGLDSKGVKHKSIEERIRDGIKAGMKKVLHPLKAFKHAYLSSLLHQQLNGVDERQIKEIIKQQEDTYDKAAMVAALSGASGKGVQRQAVKAVGAGALAMAKDMPKYKDISDAVAYTAQVQALEKEDERRKSREATKDTKATKDIMDNF